MSKTFYYISFSEYDLGQEGLIFKSREDALSYGKSQYDVNPGYETWEEFSDPDTGLFIVEEVTIYEPE